MTSDISMRVLCAGSLTLFMGLSGPVFAASPATTTLSVTLKITSDCKVNVDPLAFGAHGSLLDNIEATSNISVACSPGVKYKIGLDAGKGPSASVTARKMTNTVTPATAVDYQLYIDAARTQNWGNADTAGTGVNVTPVTSDGTIKKYTIYGRVPNTQTTPAAGDYADSVGVIVTY